MGSEISAKGASLAPSPPEHKEPCGGHRLPARDAIGDGGKGKKVGGGAEAALRANGERDPRHRWWAGAGRTLTRSGFGDNARLLLMAGGVPENVRTLETPIAQLRRTHGADATPQLCAHA